MLEFVLQPDVVLASGLAAYYVNREAYHRKLADAAHSEWQEFHGLAERYRLLAEDAAGGHPA